MAVRRGPPRTSPGRRAAWGGCLVGAALLAAGCVHEPKRPLRPTQEVYDPNPTRRAQAVCELGRVGGPEHVPLLIEALDDEDAAVRLAAGRALEDLTGHDTGYRAYAQPDELRRQVETWRAWYAAGAAPAGGAR